MKIMMRIVEILLAVLAAIGIIATLISSLPILGKIAISLACVVVGLLFAILTEMIIRDMFY